MKRQDVFSMLVIGNEQVKNDLIDLLDTEKNEINKDESGLSVTTPFLWSTRHIFHISMLL